MNIDTKVYRKHESPTFGNTLLGAVPLVSEVYLMDNIELMKHYPDKYFDLACIDPPYGIGHSLLSGEKRGSKFVRTERHVDWDILPTDNFWVELFRVSKNQIIWGGNYFTEFLPPKMGWIYWHKKGNDASNFSDGELAWTSFDRALKFVKYDWIGFGYINNAGSDKKIHPTMKPKELYEWVLENYAKKGDKILDTHLGSGSSAIASFRLGFDFVGIEIDKEYYQSSIKRFKEQTAQLRVF